MIYRGAPERSGAPLGSGELVPFAVRFPRMLRWPTDKKPADADSLETILSMLDAQNGLHSARQNTDLDVLGLAG